MPSELLISLFVSLLSAAEAPPAQCPAPPKALLQGSETTPALSGLQIVMIEHGEVKCSSAFGAAQIDEDKISARLSTDHKVRVASISKLAVGMAIMRLVEDGRLDLDQDVSESLGFQLRNPAFPDTLITVRQLLSHTSSVRDGSVYWLPAGGEIADFFTPGTPEYEDGAHYSAHSNEPPGDYFTYANLNYGILASIIERITGERFDQAVERLVLEPLGMVGASFNPCRTVSEGQKLGTLYRKGDGGYTWAPDGPWQPQVDGDSLICAVGLAPVHRNHVNAPLPEDTESSALTPTSFSPQGGLRASAEDIAQLLLALRPDENPILKPSTVRDMLSPQWQLNDTASNGETTEFEFETDAFAGLMTAWGLSVHLVDLSQWGFGDTAPKMVGHLGEAYGLLGIALLEPGTGDGLVALITGTADDPAKYPSGKSPLYRVEEEILAWWLEQRQP